MGFSVNSPGNFYKTRGFFKKILSNDIYSNLDAVGARGVDALSAVTPVRTGEAQGDWYYVIVEESTRIRVEWHNDDIENGALVVLLLQYGHATGTGGYVQGRDFINPAIKPVMEEAINEVWGKVVNG